MKSLATILLLLFGIAFSASWVVNNLISDEWIYEYGNQTENSDSLIQYGVPNGMSWDESVQGQYCNSGTNGIGAQVIADEYGVTYEEVCTKMWAVDQ